MFSTDYWNERVRRFGHTGHAEPFYYCFDQEARLYAVDTVIKRIAPIKDAALDFGCGSGDFVELLSGQFKTVSGFDTSENVIEIAKQRFNDPKIQLSGDLNDCVSGKTFDLVLSVTVLQTLTFKELEKTIALFHKILNPNGKLICMEFFSTEEYNLKANEKRITNTDWTKILHANNFIINSVDGFYNPIVFPSKSWRIYKSQLYMKLLKLFKHQTFAKNELKRKAKELIYKYKDVYPFQDSTFKVYVIEKKNT